MKGKVKKFQEPNPKATARASLASQTSDQQLEATEANRDDSKCRPARTAERIDRKRNRRHSYDTTDEYYSECLSVRSAPLTWFLKGGAHHNWVLPMTSINESRLLVELGLLQAERSQIQGLQTSLAQTDTTHQLNEEQLSSRAIIRLAVDPPPEVGQMQRRTASQLLRPFPLPLRTSGRNMSPLPGWLSGSQNVCLNMSSVDLAVQLHFALFNGSGGFVLKPLGMRSTQPHAGSDADERQSIANPDVYWPPPRNRLHRTTVDLVSLHNLPKLGERRPRFAGRHAECHKFVPELSGSSAPTNNVEPSSPRLHISLHPIGGFCAVSKVLPLPQNVDVEASTSTVDGNGMNAAFCEQVHLTAAEPHATFVRVAVIDAGLEVAYETAVLGRLRHGYRVFMLRSPLGTRIELCSIFVKISFGILPQLWATPRQVRLQAGSQSGRPSDSVRLSRVSIVPLSINNEDVGQLKQVQLAERQALMREHQLQVEQVTREKLREIKTLKSEHQEELESAKLAFEQELKRVKESLVSSASPSLETAQATESPMLKSSQVNGYVGDPREPSSLLGDPEEAVRRVSSSPVVQSRQKAIVAGRSGGRGGRGGRSASASHIGQPSDVWSSPSAVLPPKGGAGTNSTANQTTTESLALRPRRLQMSPSYAISEQAALDSTAQQQDALDGNSATQQHRQLAQAREQALLELRRELLPWRQGLPKCRPPSSLFLRQQQGLRSAPAAAGRSSSNLPSPHLHLPNKVARRV